MILHIKDVASARSLSYAISEAIKIWDDDETPEYKEDIPPCEAIYKDLTDQIYKIDHAKN